MPPSGADTQTHMPKCEPMQFQETRRPQTKDSCAPGLIEQNHKYETSML